MHKVKIPFWKHLLSQLWDISLHEVDSDINGQLSLILSNGRLKLLATECIYSYDDLYTNFREAFIQLSDKITKVKTALILGMGTASIPYMLEKYHRIECTYDLIEIDPAVIELASLYALPRISSPVQVYHTDAYSYILHNSQRYDLVVFDIFIDDLIPEKFTTIEFLRKLYLTKKENGMILWNRLYRNSEDQRETERFFNESIQSLNPNAYYLEIEGNWIIVA